MKLYKILITPTDTIPPEPELIMESEDREVLKRKAEGFARASYGLLEFLWVFDGNDQGYTELTINGKCRFVVRPW